MKRLYKIFLVMLITIGTSVSCQDGEGAVYTLQNEVDTSGAILRTLVQPADLVTLTGANNSIDFTVEVQIGDGSTTEFKEVRLYLSLFQDQDLLNPTLDENGNEISETLYSTIDSSEFGVSDNNQLPEYSFAIPTAEVVANFQGAVFTVPTFMVPRLELELNDGRIFTNTNVTATVATGAFYSSPYLYRIIFINN